MHDGELDRNQFVPTCSTAWSIEMSGLKTKLAEAEAENKTLRELLQTEASAAHSFADKRDVAEAECDRLQIELDETRQKLDDAEADLEQEFGR